MVHVWRERPEYIPDDLDVPFWFGDHYNWGMSQEDQQGFFKQYRIKEHFEVVEVFREPHSDVDAGFKGRTFIIARFDDAADAIFFRLAMPTL